MPGMPRMPRIPQIPLRLLFLADGSRWIRNWFDQVQVPDKAMILCWYHLVKKCQTQLSMACKGHQHREQVQAEVLGHLWEGRVEEALAVLQARRREMRGGSSSGSTGGIPVPAPRLFAQLPSAAASWPVDCQQPRGEIQRLVRHRALQTPGHGLDLPRRHGLGRPGSRPPQWRANPLAANLPTAHLD